MSLATKTLEGVAEDVIKAEATRKNGWVILDSPETILPPFRTVLEQSLKVLNRHVKNGDLSVLADSDLFLLVTMCGSGKEPLFALLLKSHCRVSGNASTLRGREYRRRLRNAIDAEDQLGACLASGTAAPFMERRLAL